jgi:L-amino acid N-acyltransferase YncA
MGSRADTRRRGVEERLTLRDGSAVLVRTLEREDGRLVKEVFDQMGKEARYRRFLGFKKHLSATDLETLTAVDHHGHEAFVALDAASSVAVGVAHMIQERGRPDTAEASVEVVDAWQGRGLGGALLERLVQRAREEDVRRFTSVLLTRNVAMVHLFERIGAAQVINRYGESLELAVELPFETGAPMEAIRAGAAGEVHE